MKTCKTCKVPLPLESFGLRSRYPDGRSLYCRPCERAYNERYRGQNRGRIRKISRRWREAHPDVARERVRAWIDRHPDKQRRAEINYRKQNPEKRRASCAAYRAKPGVIDKEREYRRSYAEKNKARLAAKAAKRRAMILQATPPWADLDAIGRIYEAARIETLRTGIPHEVDHYYPLKGKNSCGLHVEWNLRIITAGANRSKGNREPAA